MGLYFSISGLIFIIILMHNFFSKERIDNLETKIYKYILLISTVGLTLDIITSILYNNGTLQIGTLDITSGGKLINQGHAKITSTTNNTYIENGCYLDIAGEFRGDLTLGDNCAAIQ